MLIIKACETSFIQEFKPFHKNFENLLLRNKTMDVKRIWTQVKKNLKNKNVNNHFLQTWLEPAQVLEVKEDPEMSSFQISVPSELHKHWISQNLVELISSEISILYKNPFKINLVVSSKTKKDTFSNEASSSLKLHQASFQPSSEKSKAISSSSSSNVSLKNKTRQPAPQKRDVLNPHCTFSNFVVGRNNEFAHAAAFHIAENPKPEPNENYNPLFIFGPTGMGKTHLLHAMGNHIRQKFPHLKIKYTSAEKFLNEFISGIRRGEMDKFRKKHRQNCDVLLMDDIQVLRQGESSQEEFFHTLNHFFAQSRQVAFASDRMPKDIEGLEDRIRTRLEWGLIADIKVPDIDTRMAILKYKAETMNIEIPHEVALYIAKISRRSIRELEGNLNKVKMFSELQGLDIQLDLTRKLLSSHDFKTQMNVQDIQKITAKYYKLRISDLKSKSRTHPLILARQVSMYLIKKYLNKSLSEIGKIFGKKDHTTVINALKKIEKQIQESHSIRRDVEQIETEIYITTGE